MLLKSSEKFFFWNLETPKKWNFQLFFYIGILLIVTLTSIDGG
jgi:hypothetical protein